MMNYIDTYIFFLKSASIEKKVITYVEFMGYWITNDIASQGYWFCVDIYISEISGTFIVSNASYLRICI